MLIASLVVVVIHVIGSNDPYSDARTYIPKAQRRPQTRVRRFFGMFMKTVIGRGLEALDRWIQGLHTTRKHHYKHHFTYLRYRRPKQYRKPSARFLEHVKCQAHVANSHEARHVYFDTDSGEMTVDNGAETSMSSYIEDFIDVPVPCNKVVDGVNGSADGNMEGTIRWPIEDDEGRIHEITLPGSLYIPKARDLRLLSPQHWAQTAKDRKPLRYGTWCGTYDDCLVCWWKQRKYKRTMPLVPGKRNVGKIRTASGYKRYQAFAADINEPEGDGYDPDLNEDVNFVTDTEAMDIDYDSDDDMDIDNYEGFKIRSKPIHEDFDLNGPDESSDEREKVITDEED